MKQTRTARIFRGFLAAAVVAGASPALGASDMDEIRDSQKKILERLDAQDKTLRDILGRVSGGGAAAQPDPNQVYDIPVAHSVIKGPKDARVLLAEFSDFQ